MPRSPPGLSQPKPRNDGVMAIKIPGNRPCRLSSLEPPMLDGIQIIQRVAARGALVMFSKASRQDEFAAAFADLVRKHADAIVVADDPAFNDGCDKLVTLAARHAGPALYEWREFVDAGGLMSYGTNLNDTYRQVGVYATRILKGAKPADLPVEQPTKFELLINLKTAKAPGLTIP